MSAITGIFHLNGVDIPYVHSTGLMKALQNYPADDVQTWHNRDVFLGCHAQWITPESVGERLPYYDAERQLAITADAIIDNRYELFEMLQVEREYRKSMPDSELILLAYYKWGEAVPKYLVGDFAFMIWDERNHRLFGARDFSGSRTLYFYRNAQLFVFCTVIKPLFSLPYIEKKLNEHWLAEFLAIPGMHDVVDSFSTTYKGIEQIPPSHTITVEKGKVTFSRYSRLPEGKKIKLKSNVEYEEAFRDVFQRAVTDRLRTHHQVGAYLSGGLDSGSVVSFAARALRRENKQLHTLSYVPVDNFHDWTPKRRVANESPFIRSTVEHVGNINDDYLNFEGKSPLTEMDEMLDIFEMPYKFFVNSFWIKGILEKAHQKKIGVLLQGSRGNYSISWGSALDHYATLFRRMKWIALYRELNQYSNNTGIKKSRMLTTIRKKAFPTINKTFSSKNKDQFPTLINNEFALRTNVFEKLKEYGVYDIDYAMPNAYESRKKQFEQVFYWNISGTAGTKLSLKNSLWERDPTNDLRVIQFCLSIPEEQYVQNGLDRALIRRSTINYLPDKVRLNQRTRGIQGADVIQRITPSWEIFIEELQYLARDSVICEYVNCQVIESGISRLKEGPRSEYVYDQDFIVLMRALVVYKFLKNII